MEEKKITEKESLELITEMIMQTKARFALIDGNMLLMWGYLNLAVSLLVYIVGVVAQNSWGLWLWFLTPVIGFPITCQQLRKKTSQHTPRSYVDKIIDGIWTLVCIVMGVGIIMCAIFASIGPDVWLLPFICAFEIVGFAVAVMGIAVREKSLVAGGIFSTLAGAFILCYMLAGYEMSDEMAIVLFATSFIAMMIVPGHILNHKAKKVCSKN